MRSILVVYCFPTLHFPRLDLLENGVLHPGPPVVGAVRIPHLSGMSISSYTSVLWEAFKSPHSKAWLRQETFLSHQCLLGTECNAPSGYGEAFYFRKLEPWRENLPVQVVFGTVNTHMLEEGAD